MDMTFLLDAALELSAHRACERDALASQLAALRKAAEPPRSTTGARERTRCAMLR